MHYYVTDNRAACVPLNEIPTAGYAEFYEDLAERLADERYHIGHYFALPDGDVLRAYCLLLDDTEHRVLVASYAIGYYDTPLLPSLTARHPQVHPFEREITERYGVRFADMPWNKPLRFPFDRYDRSSSIDNYPFYTIEGASLHEVNVGPIHAGIIEPGAFRFICNGEQVLHLEIALGYQHRGVERTMTADDNVLRQTLVAESVAGDSAVAHATAYAQLREKLAGKEGAPTPLDRERAIALELERMAMHIADTGALCMDVGYQLGQVACEALRTVTINTTQAWCGNRFGKGLIRPFGTNHPLTDTTIDLVRRNIADVRRRYDEVRHDIKSSPSLLSRFEQCGIVPRSEMTRIGGVGPAARASGVGRDLRTSHPWGVYGIEIAHEPFVKQQGDVMARLMMRCRETLQSADYVLRLLDACDAPLARLRAGRKARCAGLRAGRRLARRNLPRDADRRAGRPARLQDQGPEPPQLAGAGAGRARRGHLGFPDLQQEFQPLLLRTRPVKNTLMILPKFIVRRSHGRQYIPDLDAVCLTEKFRGRPELTEPSDDEQRAALTRAAAICPTQAIAAAPFTLDMGRCLFCGECARIAPRAIRFTNDYRIGSPTREGLRLTPGMDRVPFDPAAVREQIVTTFGRALKLRQVSAGGDASVEMELNATGNVNFDFGRYGVEFTASPRHADGIVLTGPVTANMAEALDICYDAVAEPKLLIVCGSEACSGGLYAASRAVDRSFFERRHVDLWLPGAPTHPMTFIDGIRTLLRKKQR